LSDPLLNGLGMDWGWVGDGSMHVFDPSAHIVPRYLLYSFDTDCLCCRGRKQ